MIRVRFEPDKNRTAAYDDGKEIGGCEFSPSGSMWTIDHTFVQEGYGGQGIAGKLVEEVVNQARKRGIRVVPICSFARKEFARKPEYRDVLG